VKETGISALLMDLRGHGQSSHHFSERRDQTFHTFGTNDAVPLFDPPPANYSNTTIQNCAEDVIHTLYKLNLVGDDSPKGIVGHSFGGRCALAYLHHLLLVANDTNMDHCSTTTSNHVYLHPPQDCWILDSCPGKKIHPSVMRVIEAVSSIKMPIKSKQELVHYLTKTKNIDASIAAWMTTNLKKSNVGVVAEAATTTATTTAAAEQPGYHFMFDLNVIQDIVRDFPRQDMIQMLQECTRVQRCFVVSDTRMMGNIHMVIASKNDSWTPDILEPLDNIMMHQQQQQDDDDNCNPYMHLNLLQLDAGHWVHVDALDELVAVMSSKSCW
jgi:hypothetical protein